MCRITFVMATTTLPGRFWYSLAKKLCFLGWQGSQWFQRGRKYFDLFLKRKKKIVSIFFVIGQIYLSGHFGDWLAKNPVLLMESYILRELKFCNVYVCKRIRNRKQIKRLSQSSSQHPTSPFVQCHVRMPPGPVQSQDCRHNFGFLPRLHTVRP